jgi:hypothetical protein
VLFVPTWAGIYSKVQGYLQYSTFSLTAGCKHRGGSAWAKHLTLGCSLDNRHFSRLPRPNQTQSLTDGSSPDVISHHPPTQSTPAIPIFASLDFEASHLTTAAVRPYPMPFYAFPLHPIPSTPCPLAWPFLAGQT